jgi:2-polyprenyl-6-methoxyphenol hydroxylase-like FAD-dependent oxidoreductase
MARADGRTRTLIRPVERIETRCCIAGGGPAGMMLGFLLARAGVDVVVLEKHADFLRDFRGDTIHPSTLEVMHELGLGEAFLALPHQKVAGISGVIGGATLRLAEFARLPVRSPFIAFMPQWDFLDFLADRGRRYAAFRLRMETTVEDLVREGDRVTGVIAKGPDGRVEIRAELVVGADGRDSAVRRLAGLAVRDIGAPIDALWLRLSRRADDAGGAFGRFDAGRIFVTLDRGTYWQCAFVIPKGGFDALRERGLESFRAAIASIAPFLADRVGEIESWNHVSLLTVRVDRLDRWHRPGLLCIGDAAHAMSPVGGVGINLAVQDAVAAANLLWRPLRDRFLTEAHLAAVQRRRAFPTRATQRLQVIVQNRVLDSVLAGTTPGPPWPVRLLDRFALLRRLPGRLVGMGFRPEHVRSPDAR